MNSSKIHNQDLYPNATRVIQQITSLTGGQDCIFRGEVLFEFDYPGSSALYRQLKKENVTRGSIPSLLKRRQNKLIEDIRRHTEEGDSDLSRLMAYQHKGGKTNLIDFTRNLLVALFFACSSGNDRDGRIIVKRRDSFTKVIDKLPDDEVVLIESHNALLRARDQSGVLLHAPMGFLPVQAEETIVVKSEWKVEILRYLEAQHDISYETIFGDIRGPIYADVPEDESDDQYPDVILEITQQISNATKGKQCIFRGESKTHFVSCSSGLYRQLKNTVGPRESMRTRLKEEQDELIKELSRYPENGNSNLERLAYYQHYHTDGRDATNLLDFSLDSRVALFFACQENGDKDGRVVVKQKSSFHEVEVWDNILPDSEVVWFEPPPDKNRRAKDQRGVLLHVPDGTLSVQDAEIVEIKNEWKKEILKRLENEYGISHKTLFDDPSGLATRRHREYEKKISDSGSPQTATRLQGFSKPNDNQTILKMLSYSKLQNSPITETYNKLLTKDANELINTFTEVLKHNPHDAEAHYNRALVYQSKLDPDYAQAISGYSRAIDLNSNYVGAYNNRGLAYIETPNPDYAQAISDFNSALELNPKLAVTYNNRGNAYSNKPNPDYVQAISDYTSALELNPNLAMAYNNRGRTYAEMSPPDYERALKDYNRAIKLDPNYTKAYYNRTLVYQSKSDPDYAQSISDGTRAIKLNPNLAKAYNDRGNVYAKKPQPDYNQAISDYDSAIRLNPNFANAYYNRGNAYSYKLNPDYDKAISDYDSAIRLNPNFANAYYSRSNAYARKPNSDYVRAKSDFMYALKLNPDLGWGDRNRTILEMAIWADKHSPKFIRPFLDWYTNVWGRIVIGRKKSKS